MGTRRLALRAASGALMLAAASAWAAGGHHAVDDAAILAAGECELEGWLTRATGGERLAHAGANCGIGPIELGIASEYARFEGASHTGWGLEAKWATGLGRGFSIGAKVGPAWAAHLRPRYQGVSASALLSWKAGEQVVLHANLGRDFLHAGEDASRYGVSAEWFPAQAWGLLAERYKEAAAHFVRGGVRYQASENWSVDLSRSHRLGGPGASTWMLGTTWAFGGR